MPLSVRICCGTPKLRIAAAMPSQTRKVGANGVVSVSWQQVSVGAHRADARCDVFVTDQLLQFWIGEELVKTVARTSTGEVRKKHAAGTHSRRT